MKRFLFSSLFSSLALLLGCLPLARICGRGVECSIPHGRGVDRLNPIGSGREGLTTNIEEEGVEAVWEWNGMRRVTALHQRAASQGEHAGVVDELFREELGADEWMVTSEAGDLLGYETAIGGDFAGDIIGSEGENALDAILKLSG